MQKRLILSVAGISAAVLLSAATVSAQQSAPQQQSPSGMQGGGMPMMGMMQQMQDMMATCNRMMKAHMESEEKAGQPDAGK